MTQGSAADGSDIASLPCGENAWVSLVIRDGTLLPVAGATTLRQDDDVLLLADPDETDALERYFTTPVTSGPGPAPGTRDPGAQVPEAE